MRVGIVGGGAIGLLFAAYLAKKNKVTVFTRTEHQSALLKERGVTLHVGNSSYTYKVEAYMQPQQIHDLDLIIIAVKQYHLQNVLDTYKGLDKSPTLLFLQNGMGHLKIVEQVSNPNILLGVVEHGALKVNETEVIHSGRGNTKLGIIRGNDADITLLKENGTFTDEFPIYCHRDWFEILSEKLIINAVINPLSAIGRVPNGELVTNSSFYHAMESLFTEVVEVIDIDDKKKMWEKVINVCRRTAENRSSMLRDIEEGRRTELDAILGYVLTKASERNIEMPVATFLYGIIKGIEERGIKNG